MAALRTRDLRIVQQRQRRPDIVFLYLRPPAAFAPARERRLEAGIRALPDDGALELRKCAEDVEEQFAGGRRGVYCLGERAEVDPARRQLLDGLADVPGRPACAIRGRISRQSKGIAQQPRQRSRRLELCDAFRNGGMTGGHQP